MLNHIIYQIRYIISNGKCNIINRLKYLKCINFESVIKFYKKLFLKWLIVWPLQKEDERRPDFEQKRDVAKNTKECNICFYVLTQTSN